NDIHIWNEVQKLTLSACLPHTGFGGNVTLSGNTLVVAADNFFYVGQPGSAYVFGLNEVTGGNWEEVTKLTASNGAPNDLFGDPLALEGDTLIVGANNLLSGAAYIFERNAGGPDNWGEVKILAAASNNGDNFGLDADLSGDVAIVGAYRQDAVYVFHRWAGGEGQWGQVARLSASDDEPNHVEEFGLGAKVDGETAVIGARFAEIDGQTDQGAAYIFHLAPTFDLSVESNGNGAGQVVSWPPGIDCGITCTHSFAIGEVVTLTAVPHPPAYFSGWQGTCEGLADCVLRITEPQQVTATFSHFQSFLPILWQNPGDDPNH
ncbi:MAG TPA: hypothetical protein VLS48_00325, partial [Anaerolineales bacterium]|nr:hypothetical protein [Anaerolineales bacterium]